jgi:cellulose synthase/poly-beta-1,6-N-acetylglucosamine synthase-like glycosyltransferase
MIGARHEGSGRRRDRQINARLELRLTVTAILVTAMASALFGLTTLAEAVHAVDRGAWRGALETWTFLVLAALLIYGNLVYQFCRLGYVWRRMTHHPAARADIERVHDADKAPAVAFLILAYLEDPRVIRQTILSAALQEYPNREVVLLIDDDPHPISEHARQALSAARELPVQIEALLRPIRTVTRQALERYERYAEDGTRDREARRVAELRALSDLEIRVANALDRFAETVDVTSHTDALFVEQVLRAPARAHRRRALALSTGASATEEEIRRGYWRLAARFDVRVSSFERKQYVNLSHEPNKAMNLNSYIGLLGYSWRSVDRADGTHLEPAGTAGGDVEVGDPRYVVTLDADSLILPDYALRLVHLLEQPENARVAIAQSPYSAIPDAVSAIEHIAGATTDLQYIVHQGFSHYRATFWVGANAVIRKAALDDIKAVQMERGHPVQRFIHDRTVIEDTESSIDLADRGWDLLNYPERLSYSATPPDFGSLLIQRRRWANGGLIILPKLVRSVANGRGGRSDRRAETIIRTHYLTSIAAANLALLAFLLYPFRDVVVSIWLPLTAVPYFLLYARDLVQAGYRATDVVRVYALNLLLLVVNLSGVLKSLQQGLTKRKIPFGRTPKVQGRTAAPARYLLAEVFLVGFLVYGGVTDAMAGQLMNAAFAGANAAILAYAITQYIGWRELVFDLRVQIVATPARRATSVLAAALGL